MTVFLNINSKNDMFGKNTMHEVTITTGGETKCLYTGGEHDKAQQTFLKAYNAYEAAGYLVETK